MPGPDLKAHWLQGTWAYKTGKSDLQSGIEASQGIVGNDQDVVASVAVGAIEIRAEEQDIIVASLESVIARVACEEIACPWIL